MYIADYLLQEKEEDITVGLTHYNLKFNSTIT